MSNTPANTFAINAALEVDILEAKMEDVAVDGIEQGGAIAALESKVEGLTEATGLTQALRAIEALQWKIDGGHRSRGLIKHVNHNEECFENEREIVHRKINAATRAATAQAEAIDALEAKMEDVAADDTKQATELDVASTLQDARIKKLEATLANIQACPLFDGTLDWALMRTSMEDPVGAVLGIPRIDTRLFELEEQSSMAQWEAGQQVNELESKVEGLEFAIYKHEAKMNEAMSDRIAKLEEALSTAAGEPAL